jgi:hypothetical protein
LPRTGRRGIEAENERNRGAQRGGKIIHSGVRCDKHSTAFGEGLQRF